MESRVEVRRNGSTENTPDPLAAGLLLLNPTVVAKNVPGGSCASIGGVVSGYQRYALSFAAIAVALPARAAELVDGVGLSDVETCDLCHSDVFAQQHYRQRGHE